MTKTGFRVNMKQLRRKLNALAQIQADDFEKELADFAKKSLTKAVMLTPERSKSLIEQNQSTQYELRASFIPSVHSIKDPSLRINNSGTHWVYVRGKWYNATDWNLPADVYSAYQNLLAERTRRLQTSKQKFIRDRAQARFLYKKTWVEIGQSLGLDIRANAAIKASVTRRKPPTGPPKGYGQKRGGKYVRSYVIYNPLLDIPSDYKTFDHVAIMKTAMSEYENNFRRACQRRANALCNELLRKSK